MYKQIILTLLLFTSIAMAMPRPPHAIVKLQGSTLSSAEDKKQLQEALRSWGKQFSDELEGTYCTTPVGRFRMDPDGYIHWVKWWRKTDNSIWQNALENRLQSKTETFTKIRFQDTVWFDALFEKEYFFERTCGTPLVIGFTNNSIRDPLLIEMQEQIDVQIWNSFGDYWNATACQKLIVQVDYNIRMQRFQTKVIQNSGDSALDRGLLEAIQKVVIPRGFLTSLRQGSYGNRYDFQVIYDPEKTCVPKDK